ncbi:alpha/beta fold hydrolase [Streptomyces sp. B21-083]|uniref:alpha/beta fold hydrolase n=1 Tax=Streptomyces sp. B21-083 TaxID=3039410 RepID=UPI002FEF68D4
MIDTGRIRLFCTDTGPVGACREWSPHSEELAERFRVVVPDLRGHGRSGVPDLGNTLVNMADDLAALIETLGTGPVVAVGHSMGGQVVNLLAVRHPELVRSVIALDPAHGSHSAEVDGIPARLAGYRARGARAAAEFVAGAFSPATPPMSAPCSAPRTMSSPSRTRACAPTRTRSASAPGARRTCAAASSRR